MECVQDQKQLAFECIRGRGAVGPEISFFASPTKTRKKFSPSFFELSKYQILIFWREKKKKKEKEIGVLKRNN